MVQLKKKLSGKMRLRYTPPYAGAGDMPEPDIQVVTSDGIRIPAHSKILVQSPIFDSRRFLRSDPVSLDLNSVSSARTTCKSCLLKLKSIFVLFV